MGHIYNSKVVKSLQDGVHENLEKKLKRYNLQNFTRPKRSFSDNNLNQIISWLGGDSFILDLGCGVGESSYDLSSKNPGVKVLGVDKSISRISRKNEFKTENPNVLLIQDDMFDLIPLLYKELKNKVLSVFIFYPNPWPKKSQLQRRIHANPIAPFLFELSKSFVLRSNWKIYLDEFSKSYEFFKGTKSQTKKITNLKSFITPFEKKYYLSGQDIFELKIG